jgi:DNA invertase Pin-like site-specific DNA recombinase
MTRRPPRGRPAGPTHPRARLTWEDVELIRALRAAGLSYRKIARKFEVSRTCVFEACRWRTYWR